MRANAIYAANPAPINQAYSPLRLGHAAKQTYSRLTLALSNLFQAVVTALTSSSSLLVWSSKDAAGQTVWHASDKMTGKAIRDLSELEMRVWLEHRYSA
ncbi:MAG: hypothetical protein WA783_09335 [Phormidesmis sp.]